MSSNSWLSIVIPVLNEEALIADQIAHIRQTAPQAQIIVVDGGSSDTTLSLASSLADNVITANLGRAHQMNAGAALANGQYLLFLHADTRLPGKLETLIADWQQTSPAWGYFSIQLSGKAWMFRLIEFMINFRTKITGGATGDQCQIVRTDVFTSIGGFSPIPLMEDLAMSRKLRKIVPPKRVPAIVESSSRRWEERGVIRTILLMWTLRSAYTLGVHPRFFSKAYR